MKYVTKYQQLAKYAVLHLLLVITSIYTYGQQKHTNFKVLLGGNFSLFKSFLQCAQYKNCKTEYRNIVTVAGRVLFPFFKFGIPCDQF